jgi:hypothetical protein
MKTLTKTERFELRLDQGVLDNVDEWRSRQNDFPSRAEAVRRLMEVGLRTREGKKIKFSEGEKFITLMLCEVYKHLKIKGEINPKFVETTLHGGHYWGLSWQYPGIFHGEEKKDETVKEVVDVLDMWSFMERGFCALSANEKARVAKEAAPFGGDVRFRGFDGNNEGAHLSVACFLINELDRFSEFKGRDLNSHWHSIDGYRRMLSIFEPLRRTLVGAELSASQIIEILNARDAQQTPSRDVQKSRISHIE